MAFPADVIVIGSGPAGVSTAWPLVEAGVRVLMLDASDDVDLPVPPPQDTIHAWRHDPDRWRHELGADGPLASAVRSPKFATPLSQATLAGFAEAARIATSEYFAVGSLASGGLSRIWGALATEFTDDDLAPWGEQRDAMADAYARVRARIGISSPSLLARPVDRMIQAHAGRGDSKAFSLVIASNAVLAQSYAERKACNACGLCLQGCGRGSIYQAAQELKALSAFANFVYRSGTWVTGLSGTAGGHVVEARQEGEIAHFTAPVVVLAAGTLMTTKLALRRLGMQGQPVRLESNPVGGTAFLVPGLVGSAMPHQSFGLGQLFYTLAPKHGVEAAGVFYGADTLPLTAIADRLPFTRPVAMRLARALMPALVLATGYLPGNMSDNSLTVEDDGADGRLVIRGRQNADADVLLRRSFRLLGKHVRKLGGWQLPTATYLLEPGSDAHPGATLPMGGAGPAATDVMGELLGQPGLYVTDGSSLPHLSARHPTLTIMANADRIARALAQRIVQTTKGMANAC